MSANNVSITVTRGNEYTIAEKMEVKIDIPNNDTALVIFERLRNDVRRMEDNIREQIASLRLNEIADQIALKAGKHND